MALLAAARTWAYLCGGCIREGHRAQSHNYAFLFLRLARLCIARVRGGGVCYHQRSMVIQNHMLSLYGPT